MPFLAFYITYPNEETARRVAGRLVQDRLAACANIFPVSSAYWWEGTVQEEQEWVSVLKTRPEFETRLEEAILKIHPYEVPCIARFEMRANAAYEKWIFDSTAPA